MKLGLWLCLLCLAGTGLARGAEPEGKVTLRMEGFRNNRGEAMVLLFGSKDGFPSSLKKAVKTTTVKVADRKAEVTLGPFPQGAYAIAVMHDENGNGKLDTLLGIPREGWGMSNNPKARTRVPRFDEAKFDLDSESRTVTVKMVYLR